MKKRILILTLIVLVISLIWIKADNSNINYPASNSMVDKAQEKSLATDLQKVDSEIPVVVSTHVPFPSRYYPTLQGHMHHYEEIKVKGVQFIRAGAVSASWWGGAYRGAEDGYLLLHTDGDDFQWKFIDYGWEVKY